MSKITNKTRLVRQKRLTIQEKSEILKKLSAGASIKKISQEYCVNKSTVCRIKQMEGNLKSFVGQSESGPGNRKNIKLSGFPRMEKALHKWFLKKRAAHIPISNHILCEKAKYLHNKIKERPEEFHASTGWLSNFKKRYGVRFLKTSGEKVSNASELVQPFLLEFEKRRNEKDFSPDQIYNADESGLFWKLLPEKTLVHFRETSAPGRKTSKQRITFLVCTNASGEHKLKPFVIGKAKKPRALKNMTDIPVTYKGNKNAWMTLVLFDEWIKSNFAKEVLSYLQSKNLPKKVLLLLDNAPCHPKNSEIDVNGLSITIMCFPPNCTALLQPMDQNVIRLTKLSYKNSLLSHLVASSNYEDSLKNLNLKHAICFLASAWKDLNPTVVAKCWKMVLRASYDNWVEEDNIPLIEIRNQILSERSDITTMLNQMFPNESLDRNDIAEWISENFQNELPQDALAESGDSDDTDEELFEIIHPTSKIKLEDAIKCFTTCLEWAEQNDSSVEDMIHLQQMRERAVSKRLNTRIQPKISEYFFKK